VVVLRFFAVSRELWDEAGREGSLLSVLESSSELQLSSSALGVGMVWFRRGREKKWREGK